MRKLARVGSILFLFVALSAATATPALAGTGSLGGPSSASVVSVDVELRYEPGSASATRPSIDPITDKITWKCAFAGWRSGVRVDWQCNLRTSSGALVDKRTG